MDKKSTFTYTAGQYITVYFDHSSTPAGKAYSLSSAPHEKLLSITVKKIGEFSGRLHALRVGDTFEISTPYGFFNPRTTKPLVCLAAGCGVAPIWSILKDELAYDAQRIAHLWCSNKTPRDIAFHGDITRHEAQHERFVVDHHVTQSQRPSEGMHNGRVDLDTCLLTAEKDAMYLVCGSVNFVRSMWQGLIARGVSADAISTETFFE